MTLLILGICLCVIGAFAEIDGIRRLRQATETNYRATETFNRATEMFNRATEMFGRATAAFARANEKWADR